MTIYVISDSQTRAEVDTGAFLKGIPFSVPSKMKSFGAKRAASVSFFLFSFFVHCVVDDLSLTCLNAPIDFLEYDRLN